MSENNPAVVSENSTDFTDKDLAQINTYIEAGLPSIAQVDGEMLTRILDLYLSGKPYRQISTILNVNKSIILYLSHKYNWFQLRKEYLEDLEQTVRGRLMESKLVNQDFLLLLTQMWQKKIGDHIVKYLATGKVEHANAIDLKEVDKYLKTIEILHRLGGAGSGGGNSAPAVGLNLGDGVTIEKKGDNTVEITPKGKAIGDALKAFADSRREEEKIPIKK